ncbi:septum formation initiator family protein [Streptomyces sp. Li-HN-5-11]|uniref:septum formation initiator family protein n=1 Tax=Streptomyces sp. Li-HN-5-11 TaxID=3075432 RepID=UPI0028AFCA60|nr:septum formation initiator family protein [Streptomyces sp. Li-HN-5-11]WNM34542.1 septum formation initiator family protein [Streptomyces sp. Li-HN-5-11]
MSSKPELRGRAARLARLIPANRQQAARTPFVLLVVLLLGGGLIGLLVLNSALSEGAFQMDDLQKDTKNLTDEEQALQRDIDSYSAPDALQRRAHELGMVPGGDPAFLNPDGTVKGVPSAAAEQSSLQDEPLALRPPEALVTSPSPADGPFPAVPDGAPPAAPEAAPPAVPQSPSPAGPAVPLSLQPATTTTPGR